MSTENPIPQSSGPHPGYGQPHPQYAPPAAKPRRPFFRPADGRMIGGVCAAVADYFGWDRTAVRLLTVASVFLPGPQVIAYLVLWAAVPDEHKFWSRNPVVPPAPPA
ncbi:hypothetical protein DNL40_09550 [Xylanimonas oleitrophica]|uniref:Phage shock protein PspC N-terminal domain-containing protein n=1 Tax=Xylanimonas oleitrophica TaxID=2607479 RepID=A0A2W5WX89_9MICO|nr:hypothetical protein DNL40_09550 [Xylanimonas oleitrophica]